VKCAWAWHSGTVAVWLGGDLRGWAELLVHTENERMGRSKRHFKGNNKSNDKKRRRENEEEWQQKRQDNRDEFVTKPGNEK
jgi:hypothetical protein